MQKIHLGGSIPLESRGRLEAALKDAGLEFYLTVIEVELESGEGVLAQKLEVFVDSPDEA